MATYEDQKYIRSQLDAERRKNIPNQPPKPLGETAPRMAQGTAPEITPGTVLPSLQETDKRFGAGAQSAQRAQAGEGFGGTNSGGDGAMNAPKEGSPFSLDEQKKLLSRRSGPWITAENSYSAKSVPQRPTIGQLVNEQFARELAPGTGMTPAQREFINQAGPTLTGLTRRDGTQVSPIGRLGAFDAQGNPIKSGGTFSVVGKNGSGSGLDQRQQLINTLMGKAQQGKLFGAGLKVLKDLMNKDLSASVDREGYTSDRTIKAIENAAKGSQFDREQMLEYAKLRDLSENRKALLGLKESGQMKDYVNLLRQSLGDAGSINVAGQPKEDLARLSQSIEQSLKELSLGDMGFKGLE